MYLLIVEKSRTRLYVIFNFDRRGNKQSYQLFILLLNICLKLVK